MCVPYYILVLYEAASYALNIGRTELVEVSSIHHFYMAAGTLLICSPAVNGKKPIRRNDNLEFDNDFLRNLDIMVNLKYLKTVDIVKLQEEVSRHKSD